MWDAIDVVLWWCWVPRSASAHWGRARPGRAGPTRPRKERAEMAAKQQSPATPQSYEELVEELGAVFATMERITPTIVAAMHPSDKLKSLRKTTGEWVEQVTVELG